MKPYLDLLRRVLEEGEVRKDRTGVGTLSLFGAQVRYDLRQGFPLVTTKKVNFDLVKRELLWFLSGSTNVNDLGPAKFLWEPWAKPGGYLGRVYGSQWRDWGGTYDFEYMCDVSGIDQISEVIRRIKTDPTSRRHVVSAWNVSDLPRMALPPCHVLFQFYVSNGHLDLQLYQRSADMAVGVPFNVASYSLLLSMVAMECELVPRYFIHSIGDAHIYENHVEGVRKQLEREPLALPSLYLEDRLVLEHTVGSITLEGYDFWPFIKFKVAV